MSRQSRPVLQILLLPLATIISLTCFGVAHARDPGPGPRGKAGAEIGERSEGMGQMKGQMLAETSTVLQSGATAQKQAQETATEQEAKAAQAQAQMTGAMAGQAAAGAAGAAALGASLRASAASVAGAMSAMVSSTRAQ